MIGLEGRLNEMSNFDEQRTISIQNYYTLRPRVQLPKVMVA
jgi:hypothetical protein